MIEFIQNNLSFIIFIFFLSIFILIKRKNVEIQGAFPFFYMILYKTRLGLDKMNKWANKHQKLFLYLSYLSIFVGIVGLFLSFFLMIWSLSYTIDNNLSAGGGLVLPIKTESGLDGAVPIFYVPFVYWIIALFILVVVHEFAHGVIAERFRIKIKSSGFAFGSLLIPILPAAFVEPDEKQLKKAAWWKQIAVLGAGSTSNFLFGFLFLLIWLFIAIPFVDNTQQVNSIYFNNVYNESSLYQYNISSGEILALNDNYNKTYILEYFSNMSINETFNLTINLSNGSVETFNIKTFENPTRQGKGMVGISGLKIDLKPKNKFSYFGNFPLYFEKMMYYLWMLNIGIGIMNLLPIWITDGGQIALVLLRRKFKEKKAIKYFNMISIFSLLLIIFTIWPSILISIINLF